MNIKPQAQTTGARSVDDLKRNIADNLYYLRGSAIPTANNYDAYFALAYAVRNHLVDHWRKTTEAYYEANPKFVYYFSAEYLLGQQLTQNLLYTDLWDMAREATAEFDSSLPDFISLDKEPGLGNGGLGRLAACYLDSLATLNIPAVGYGIRYEYGIFRQSFDDGWQIESPDDWLLRGNPWEFIHPDDMVEIGFYGHCESYDDAEGRSRTRWLPDEHVLGEPCHMMVPGFGTQHTNLIRLWRARAAKAFDLAAFDTGDFVRAVSQKVESETITKVLYPDDSTPQGRELRLKQQYFFVACSLQDIIRRFHIRNSDWEEFPNKVVIQLNDTHPVIAIPELMRILVDLHDLDWDRAWDICRRVFAYTCHTLLPEALETWSVELFERLLPRHLEIIYEINYRFLQEVRSQYPGDEARVARLSIIQETPERRVRMANLATVGCFSVNGVAPLQSRLLTELTLHDFAELWPHKFQNVTNGVTPRRFMRIANPLMSEVITETIGEGWLIDLDRLNELEAHSEDESFRKRWREVKEQNKESLAKYISTTLGLEINPDSLFDVMVKRLHEYKRQLLKVLHIITLYDGIKNSTIKGLSPRTFIFGAKAAPAYVRAKLIIKLINNVADVINHDPEVHDLLKIAFLPNYNVTQAEKIYPAGDLSEQISLAGKEASGTSNMKFALNGALTIGTLDGANIDIRERVGAENFYLFGLNADEVMAWKGKGYHPQEIYNSNAGLRQTLDLIASGAFANGNTELFKPIVDDLINYDQYMLLADYASYIEVSEQAATAFFKQPDSWTRSSILNVARCGYFSSDRAVREYCQNVWKVQPIRLE